MAPIFGLHAFDTDEPADIRQMSTFEKSNFSRSWHLSVWSPKETSVPSERRDAIANTSSAGKLRSESTFIISRPTFPVAPTTATL
jgi:hypothetical protein